MSKEISIKTTTKKDRIQLLSILLKLGYKWHDERDWTANKIDDEYGYEKFPEISVKVEGVYMCGNRSGVNTHLEYPKDSVTFFDELLNLDIPIEVTNVGSYTAKIYRDKIEVGCQNISLEKFAEIVAAVNEKKKNG
jgi:hypothetical protein